mgnify:CR=1 FL=1
MGRRDHLAAVEMFFIFLMVIHNNPFETFVTGAPVDGKGLNPLLQNFYMAIHPPSLYTGFVAMTIPLRVRHGGARSPGISTTRGCAPCAAGR